MAHRHKPRMKWIQLMNVRYRAKVCRSCALILPDEIPQDKHIRWIRDEVRLIDFMGRANKLRTFQDSERMAKQRVKQMNEDARIDAERRARIEKLLEMYKGVPDGQ